MTADTQTADATETFDEAVTRFVETAQAQIDHHYATQYPNLRPCKLTIGSGKKYLRIWTTTHDGGGQKSIFVFIQKAEGKFPVGSVLKAASWKAPALNHARGTILGEAKDYGVTVHGANYRG